MARFARAADVLLVLDAVVAALFMWGPGLTVPPATSVSPPSACIAQAPVYHSIVILQVIIVGLFASSGLLCTLVRVELAEYGDSLAGTPTFFRRKQRVCMLVAVVFTGLAVGLGLGTYFYVLEAKASVFGCLPVLVRVSFSATYAITAVICIYFVARMVWIVATSE